MACILVPGEDLLIMRNPVSSERGDRDGARSKEEEERAWEGELGTVGKWRCAGVALKWGPHLMTSVFFSSGFTAEGL